MKRKFRIFTLLLTILAGVIIILILSFLIYSYTRLSDKQIPEEYFYNKLYITQDSSVRLIFGEDLNSVWLSSASTTLTCEYNENILTLTDGEQTYNFIVIDDSTIFGDVAGYMFLVGE